MTLTLADFEGAWRLTRQITHANSPPAAFTGTAIWSPVPQGLAYHETGALQVAGHPPMPAERRYLWKSDLSVWFEDGRFFHHVPAQGGDTAHWCDPDQYDVHYDFTSWPQFRVIWRVNGPTKDYEMTSLYSPKI